MKLKKILVVYKKSAFDVYARERKDRQFLQLLRRKDDITDRFVNSDRMHNDSLSEVKKILKKRGIKADFSYRSGSFKETGYDLILTVGGDGTFLDASHRVLKTPMLGVNSSPNDSVGMFCGATAKTLDAVLNQLQKGKLQKLKLARLSLRKKGKNIGPPVLNDVLITHSNPAATTRYLIRIPGRKAEEHKSSGIWISPPAGSTAAILAAGGKVVPIQSRTIQFVIRELYRNPGWSHQVRRGVLQSGKIHIKSKMRNGRVFLDGPHQEYDFLIGENIEIGLSNSPLQVYGYNVKRRGHFR